MLSFLSFALFVHAHVGTVQSVLIQFYENKKYDGYLFETDSAPSCTNIPYSYRPVEGSIKTDTCLMAYMGTECTGYSTKILPGGQDVDMFMNGEWWYRFNVSSYHVCNEQEGGDDKLDVDIYENIDLRGFVVASFKDICSCQNLPRDFHQVRMSVDNHGNSMKVYTGQDCSGESKTIPAGRNIASDRINDFYYPGASGKILTKERGIKSIGPHEKSLNFPRHCVKLYSNVYKFEFLKSYQNNQPLMTEYVELAAKTTFHNNGRARLSQTYAVTRIVKETIEVFISNSLVDMYRVAVDPYVELDGDAGIPLIAESAFISGLMAEYYYERDNATLNSRKKTVENDKELQVKQDVEVGVCAEYTVQGYVKMVRNQPIEYKAFTWVTGELGRRKMTTKQIRERMDKRLEYLQDLDEHTVAVIARGQMRAEYGVDSGITGVGLNIVGCDAHPGNDTCGHSFILV